MKLLRAMGCFHLFGMLLFLALANCAVPSSSSAKKLNAGTQGQEHRRALLLQKQSPHYHEILQTVWDANPELVPPPSVLEQHGTGRKHEGSKSIGESARRLKPEGYQSAIGGAPQYLMGIVSGPRSGWGRHLTNLLMSVFANGLHPRKIVVAWSKPKGSDTFHNSSLLYNIRYSSYVKVLYPPKTGFPINYGSSYLLGLMIPDVLQLPYLPLVLLEDDVVFVHDFTSRLQHAVTEVEADMTKRECQKPFAYMINLYQANGSVNPLDVILPFYHSTVEKRTPKTQLLRGRPSYGFGSQGVYWSPTLRRDVTQFFYLAVNKLIPYAHTFSDMYINNYLYMAANCSTLKKGSDCETYAMRPSMLEHIGASSSWKGWNSQRMHISLDFPYKINFPKLDENGTWRRLLEYQEKIDAGQDVALPDGLVERLV